VIIVHLNSYKPISHQQRRKRNGQQKYILKIFLSRAADDKNRVQ
jgi:hypothetical protein